MRAREESLTMKDGLADGGFQRAAGIEHTGLPSEKRDPSDSGG